MRTRALLFTLALATVGCAQSQNSALFTAEERDAVRAYWARPDRYTVKLPQDAMERGVWQVRLTTAGSQWLWNYQRGKKILPGMDVVSNMSDEQKEWEKWVTARIERDRWQAHQLAIRANEEAIGKRLPAPDKTIPAQEPKDPGPIPAGLVSFVGNPPKFAQVVSPMQHEVVFDDVTIRYRDYHRPGSPRYAYYRYDAGVGDAGTQVKTMPKEQLDRYFEIAGVSDSEAKVMRAVSLLEGGFDSVNTYDTGYVSIGFIQFACLKEGGGSLGQMLLSMKTEAPAEFQRDFRQYGLDVTPEGLLAALDLETGTELIGPAAAQEIIEDKRHVAVFQRAGQKSEPFVAAQIKSAKRLYFPADDAITITAGDQTLTGKVTDIFRTEAGMATLMDRKVNTGKLDPLPALLNDLVAKVKPTSLADLAAYERDLIVALKYRKDYLVDATLSQPDAATQRNFTPSSRGNNAGRNRRGGSRTSGKPVAKRRG